MKAKKRTVRFFEPILVKQNGEKEYLPDSFWKELFDYVKALDKPSRVSPYRGRPYVGVSNSHVPTTLDYLYIGKQRPRGDYPDDVDDAGQTKSIALNTTIKSLVEPGYLVPTGVRSIVAVLRSSGGPSPEAMESWLGNIGGFTTSDATFKLAAVAQEDMWERLDRAVLVSKVEVRVQPHAQLAEPGAGEFSNAVADVMALSEFDASIDMTISFGHEVPDTVAGLNFTAKAKDFLKSKKFSKAKATTKIQNDRGGWDTENINFINEIVTHSIRVGDSEDEPLTPDLVLPEIQRAIEDFKTEF
jgi:hypothetical protein